MVRYAASAYQILHYQDLLLARNFEAWPVPYQLGTFIGSGTSILILFGTIGTLWFIGSNIKPTQTNKN